jgi:cell wall assembly regulator SMI1
MHDTQDADTPTLRAALKREAEATFERLGQAFHQRTGLPIAQTNWYASLNAAQPQVAEAERVMGISLPADLVACYAASHGVLETCGWHWWPLHDVALKFRLMNTIAYELRLGEPGWFAPEGHFSADGAVRADAWHRGWIPVAESSADPHGYLLCVDTAPGPNGQWGQLIEVQNPRHRLACGEPLEPARRVASGLLAYWNRLADVLAASPVPEAVAFWAEKPRERRLRADQVPLGHDVTHQTEFVSTLRSRQLDELANPSPKTSPSHPALDLQSLLDAQTSSLAEQRAGRLAPDRTLRVTRVSADLESTRSTHWQSNGDDASAMPWLREWASARSTAFGLLVGWQGDGKTDLLLRLVDELTRAHRASPKAPWPLYIDLAGLTDHRSEHAPATLSYAIGAELRRRKLPDAYAAVMQAVSDGACVLILDHAEAVAPYHASVWEWAQQLPPASAGRAPKQARLLMACTQEFFDSDQHLGDAALQLCQARINKQESVHVLALSAVDGSAQGAWLEAAGLDVDTDPALRAAWSGFSRDSHGLPARAKALRAVLQGTSTPRWPDLYAAWWQHCLPADLGLDEEAMTQHAIWIDMIQTQNEAAGNLSQAQHAWLVQHQWPQATPARQARLRMACRVGLHLQVEQGASRLPQRYKWLAHGMVAELEAGKLDSVVEGMIEGPRSAFIASETARAWFEAGHSQPPQLISQWLRAPQAARAAGALLQLGCEIARVLAWQEARSQHELIKQRTTPKSPKAYLRDALAATLPSPLSAAQLVGADLRGANLADLVLEDADLSGANLAGAQCQRAEFIRVRLDRACADGACFDEARFIDVEGDQLVARASSWLGARWNRPWPSADLRDAHVSVPGITPSTAATEFRLQPTTGAAAPPLRRLACSPDGRWLAAFGSSGTVGVWRSHDLTPAWHVQMPGGPLGELMDLCFSHDGQQVIASHGDASLRSWSVSEGTLVAEHQRPQSHPVHQLLPLGDGGYLVGLSIGGQTAVLDQRLNKVSGIPTHVSWGLGGATYGAAVQRSDRSSSFACVRSFRDGGVFEFAPLKPKRSVRWGPRNVWRMATGGEWLAVLEPDALWIGDPDADTAQWHIPRPHAVVHGEAYHLLVQQAQQRMAPFARNNTAGPLLDERQSFDRHARIADIVFSPDGRWLVCVGGGQTDAIAVDTRSGAVHSLDATAGPGATSATFTVDGCLILGGTHLVVCPLPKS